MTGLRTAVCLSACGRDESSVPRFWLNFAACCNAAAVWKHRHAAGGGLVLRHQRSHLLHWSAMMLSGGLGGDRCYRSVSCRGAEPVSLKGSLLQWVGIRLLYGSA